MPPEPDCYVAADAIGAERAAELAASPAATWLDDLNSTEMSALAREALRGSPDLQIAEARYRAARWRARGAFGAIVLPSLAIGADGTRTETPDPLNSERAHTQRDHDLERAGELGDRSLGPPHRARAGLRSRAPTRQSKILTPRAFRSPGNRRTHGST